MISLIAAVAENGVIGANNALLWHLPKDFAWFKEKTMGKPVIMGRKTHESIGMVLPKRENVVITRSSDYVPLKAGVRVEKSLTDALENTENEGEVFVIGGGEIYEQALPLADKLYITLVHEAYEGDVYFPEFDPDEWQLVFEEVHDAEEEKPGFTFMIMERKT